MIYTLLTIILSVKQMQSTQMFQELNIFVLMLFFMCCVLCTVYTETHKICVISNYQPEHLNRQQIESIS